jgi:CheY-like chemotaxis protein
VIAMTNTLVVLDDDAIFHKIIDYAHAKSGSYTHIYHDYQAGKLLEYLYAHKDDGRSLPDVIFVDLYLPMMDGWDFLDGYKRLVGLLCKKINVYILTTSIRREDKQRATSYAFVEEYLTKPVATDKLRAIALKARFKWPVNN